MKSLVVHYKNKYPNALIHASDSAIDVYHRGEHMVAVRKDGHGHWVDAELGAKHKHSLEPLPKDARAWKLYKDGAIGPSEEYDDRVKKQAEYDKAFGYVPSQAELDAKLSKKKA